MTKPLGLGVWVFLLIWLVTGAATGAWAADHSARRQPDRSEKKLAKKHKKKAKKTVKKADDEEDEAETAKPQPRPVAAPEAFLSQAREEEKEGDITACLQTLSKFINLYPRHPQRAATLFRLAQIAQENQQPDRALHAYALVASLYPDNQMAGEARWQTKTLGFYQDLRGLDPLATFKNYLLKKDLLPGGVAPAKLREPILRGWQEVERAVRKKSPCPVTLLERVLTLWDLHPEGTQPPEGALLIGELLQENGLYWQARSYLQQARDQGSPAVRTQALVGLLAGAWAARDLQDFAATWMVWRRNRGEITPALQARLEKLPLPQGFFSAVPAPGEAKKPDADAVAVLLDWWSGKSPDGSRVAALIQCLEHFLHRSLPPAMKERLKQQLAQLQWFQGNYAQAAKNYQELLAVRAKGENSAFYKDRLALAQLKAQHPQAAVEILQGLAQEKDNFSQLLSRTRLADMELGRMQMEPAQ
jgi:tetratricopeptide (TPR) repeat protein